MGNLILAGLYTEGSTDVRFLSAVVKNTLDYIALECSGDIEPVLHEVKIKSSGLDFVSEIYEASKEAYNFGAVILFVHTDADNTTDSIAFQNKIDPAIKFLHEKENVCKKLVAVVPIQMTEAWMLANKDLLKREIGVIGTNHELGISKRPEEFSNPKSAIENIIRISKQELTKRKRAKGLDISELYQIIGLQIEISDLQEIPSYVKFQNNLRTALKELNYLHQ